MQDEESPLNIKLAMDLLEHFDESLKHAGDSMPEYERFKRNYGTGPDVSPDFKVFSATLYSNRGELESSSEQIIRANACLEEGLGAYAVGQKSRPALCEEPDGALLRASWEQEGGKSKTEEYLKSRQNAGKAPRSP